MSGWNEYNGKKKEKTMIVLYRVMKSIYARIQVYWDILRILRMTKLITYCIR